MVDSLLDAVKTTGVDYCKRYYSLKKGILKNTQRLETMTWADRNASINIGTSSESYTWNEAVDIVKAHAAALRLGRRGARCARRRARYVLPRSCSQLIMLPSAGATCH